jgi:hypothetical protein
LQFLYFLERFKGGTLESRIDVGPGKLKKILSVGLGKFGKNDEYRALNKHRKLENICSTWKNSKI